MGLSDATDSRELLPELADVPGHLIWRSAARVTAALAEVLPPGVDIHAYAALLALADGPARSQQSLADSVAISRTTMVKVAAALVDQGLVERVRNPDDRRSYAAHPHAGRCGCRPEVATARRGPRGGAHPRFHPSEREELRGLLLEVAQPRAGPRHPRRVAGEHRASSSRGSTSGCTARSHEALAPLGIEPRALRPGHRARERLGPVAAGRAGPPARHQRRDRRRDGRPPRGARAGRTTPSRRRPAHPGPAPPAPAPRRWSPRPRSTCRSRITDPAAGPRSTPVSGKRLIALLQRFVTGG